MMTATTSQMSRLFVRNRIVLILLAAFFCAASSAQEWILAASPFTFTQNMERSSSLKAKAELLPQLILERVSDSSFRMTTDDEMLERKLDELVQERQSFFLQLSKEVKTRDAYVLSETSGRALKKKISAQDKKISDLKKQIDENLLKTQKARNEVSQRIAQKVFHEEKDEGFSIRAINPFSYFGQKKEEPMVDLPRKENIKLYKGEATSLFVPTKEQLLQGYDSVVFEKAVRAEKITALLTGKLTVYGEYAQVSVSLYIYPGREVTASVTEVGNLNDCESIAQNIASSLMPKISNSREVQLIVKTEPPEILSEVLMSIDGVVLKNFGGKASVDSGRHVLEFSAPDYPSKSIVYDFDMADAFLITVPFEKERNIVFNVDFDFSKPLDIYTFGQKTAATESDNCVVTLQTSSSNVLGQAVLEGETKTVKKQKLDKDGNPVLDEDGKAVYEEVLEKLPKTSFFFYVPYDYLEKSVTLKTKARPIDTAAEIDKRRIWTYRAYTAMVISIPFTLYATGRYNAAVNAYNNYELSDTSKIDTWNTVKNISSGVTIACAGFFVFELVRYLRTASKVLPYEPKSSSSVPEPSLIEYEKSENEGEQEIWQN